MNNMMAYCGLDCSKCPAYVATQKNDMEELKKVAKQWSKENLQFKEKDIMCDGCFSETQVFSWCNECEIRACCRGKELGNCGFCEDYPCELLNNVFDNDISAKRRLDEIHSKNFL
jgi:hypothetical protein